MSQRNLPIQMSTLSVEDETLPVMMSAEPAIEEEGKIQDLLGQDKDTTDCTLVNTKGMSQPVCPQYISFEEPRLVRDPVKKLEFKKKLLALAIICLISSCLCESPLHTLPKTLRQNRGIHMDHQNFVWEPGGRGLDKDDQVKERIKRGHDYLMKVQIFRLKRDYDQPIRLKRFEHDLKGLLLDSEDQD